MSPPPLVNRECFCESLVSSCQGPLLRSLSLIGYIVLLYMIVTITIVISCQINSELVSDIQYTQRHLCVPQQRTDILHSGIL